jgi:cellulose synthase/poly-beta-1,6-N-acetylglucosamine synthase-like glycosyltransferase
MISEDLARYKSLDPLVQPSKYAKQLFLPERPFVSVVIPTYNRAEIQKMTLKAIMNQDYPDYEFIVVDDGSTDHTAVNSYEARIWAFR